MIPLFSLLSAFSQFPKASPFDNTNGSFPYVNTYSDGFSFCTQIINDQGVFQPWTQLTCCQPRLMSYLLPSSPFLHVLPRHGKVCVFSPYSIIQSLTLVIPYFLFPSLQPLAIHKELWVDIGSDSWSQKCEAPGMHHCCTLPACLCKIAQASQAAHNWLIAEAIIAPAPSK